tara:strand:+ start:1109 stop:2371 length:1263 start_codon:yes stop_codon:yes gene_type:complete
MDKINLIKTGTRLDVAFYSGAIKAKTLLDNCGYPTYDPKLGGIVDGYQRLQKDSAIAAVAERTRRSLDDFDAFVDNINGNVRDPDVHELMVRPLNSKKTGDGEVFTFDYAPNSLKLPQIWTVDGQTRVKGLALARAMAEAEKAYKEVAKINEKSVGINLTFTADIYKECFIFYLLNHYSTNIPPEGALRMMYDGFKNGKVNFKNEITSKRGRTSFADIQSMEVTENLSQNSPIWSDSISDFNEENRANKISIRAMTNILKPLSEKIDSYRKEKGLLKSTELLTYEIFNAYWEGLALWAPEMFEDQTKGDYGTMKSSQAEVLTQVLIKIFEEHRSWKKLGTAIGSLTDPKTYEDLVKVAFDKNHLDDENGAGNKVKGPDCWMVGKAGSMGKYTNSAAKRDMRDKLFNNIKAELKKNNPSII